MMELDLKLHPCWFLGSKSESRPSNLYTYPHFHVALMYIDGMITVLTPTREEMNVLPNEARSLQSCVSSDTEEMVLHNHQQRNYSMKDQT